MFFVTGRYSNRMEFKGADINDGFALNNVDIATEWNLKFYKMIIV